MYVLEVQVRGLREARKFPHSQLGLRTERISESKFKYFLTLDYAYNFDMSLEKEQALQKQYPSKEILVRYIGG